MKFIGHLDVMRCFQKVIHRAGVDACHSGGPSLHQVISFVAPLGVGTTSNGEYVDMEAASTKDPETMKRCLNEVMSEGFEVVSYRILPDDAANATSIIGTGDHTLTSRSGYEPEDMNKERWLQGLTASFEHPSVMVTKQTKCGEKKMDLKPLVHGLSIYLEGDGEMEGSRLFMKISTGNAANVKLEQVLDAYYGFPGKGRPLFAFMVQREEVYTDRASEVEKEADIHPFISLEQPGEEIKQWAS